MIDNTELKPEVKALMDRLIKRSISGITLMTLRNTAEINADESLDDRDKLACIMTVMAKINHATNAYLVGMVELARLQGLLKDNGVGVVRGVRKIQDDSTVRAVDLAKRVIDGEA